MKAIPILLFFFIAFCTEKKHERIAIPENEQTPPEIFFVKSKSGGFWCHAEVHAHRNNAVISMYHPLTGELIGKKRFAVICFSQKNNPLWIEDLSKQIDYYDGEKFRLKRLAGQDSCWLQSTGP